MNLKLLCITAFALSAILFSGCGKNKKQDAAEGKEAKAALTNWLKEEKAASDKTKDTGKAASDKTKDTGKAASVKKENSASIVPVAKVSPESLKLESFMGIRFGGRLEESAEQVLDKPFRCFDTVKAYPTSYRAISTMTLTRNWDKDNWTEEKVQAEVDILKGIIESKYGITMTPYNQAGEVVLVKGYEFRNKNMTIVVRYRKGKYSWGELNASDSWLQVGVWREDIIARDKSRENLTMSREFESDGIY